MPFSRIPIPRDSAVRLISQQAKAALLARSTASLNHHELASNCYRERSHQQHEHVCVLVAAAVL